MMRVCHNTCTSEINIVVKAMAVVLLIVVCFEVFYHPSASATEQKKHSQISAVSVFSAERRTRLADFEPVATFNDNVDVSGDFSLYRWNIGLACVGKKIVGEHTAALYSCKSCVGKDIVCSLAYNTVHKFNFCQK